jgi:hypothetical protein
LYENSGLDQAQMNVQDACHVAKCVEETSQPALTAGKATDFVSGLFLNLPPELSSTVLTCWLGLTDIARLDSAMCTRKDRDAFLTTVYQCPCALYDCLPHRDQLLKSRNRHPYGKPEFLRWVLLREVQLSSLEIDALSGAEHRILLTDVVRMSRSCLKTVQTSRSFSGIGNTLADLCTTLVSLSCGGIEGLEQASVLDQLLGRCPALQHLKFASCDSHATKVIRKCGGQIRSLYMADARPDSRECLDWAYLIPYLPNLTGIEIPRNSHFVSILLAVGRHCPRLRALRTAIETT